MQQQKNSVSNIHVNFLYFLHDLSLSVEIWQAIRNTDHKHLLYTVQFAIIDDQIPGPYTIHLLLLFPVANYWVCGAQSSQQDCHRNSGHLHALYKETVAQINRNISKLPLFLLR